MSQLHDLVTRITRSPLYDQVRRGPFDVIARLGVVPPPLPTVPSPIFYVSNTRYGLDDTGRYWLRGNDHKRIIFRGINFPILDDWDFPQTRPVGALDELAKSGANSVRIQWYATYPSTSRPPYTLADLDRVIERCRTNRLVPIVELHDCTCEADAELVNTKLMQWWTRPDVMTLLKRHERYLVINLANELGSYRWQGWSPDALTKFKTAYKKAITSIRSSGLKMPIMIDAPDCGTTASAWLSIGQELIDHDPQHSLLFSAHAYWAADYDGSADVDLAIQARLPIVIGEIANKQSNTVTDEQGQSHTEECYYALDGTNVEHPPQTNFRYQNFLLHLTQYEIGWLAWAWYKDGCEHRRMTLDGNYTGAIEGSPTGLTPYGTELLYNGTYGLRMGYFRPQKSTPYREPPRHSLAPVAQRHDLRLERAMKARNRHFPSPGRTLDAASD